MNFSGRIKIITDLMCRNWVLPVLLLGMGFIAMYMVDTSMSYYFYGTDIVRQYTAPVREDIDTVFYVEGQAVLEEQTGERKAAYGRFAALMPQIAHISYSGKFVKSRTSAIPSASEPGSLTDFIITERSLLMLSNLGLDAAQIAELQNYDGALCPVMVGANLAQTLPVGTTFSLYGQETEDCIVFGTLPKGAQWIKAGRMSAYDGFSTLLDDQLLVCPRQYRSMFQVPSDADERNLIYYVCEKAYQDEVFQMVHQTAAECGYAITIRSLGDMADEVRQEYGLTDNKQFISAVMLMALAVTSMSVAVAATCILRKNEFGVMYAFGISMKDIGQMIVWQNVLIAVLSGAAAWLVRKREIYKMYMANGYVMPQEAAAWNWAHNNMMPLLLVGCMVILAVVSSLVPILMLKKEKPAAMIQQRD